MGVSSLNGNELFERALACTPNVGYYLPKNVGLRQLFELARLVATASAAARGFGGSEAQEKEEAGAEE